MTLVVIDADVLGRQRTGDETYVRNLLAELAQVAPSGIRLAAATRRPLPHAIRAASSFAVPLCRHRSRPLVRA